MATPAPFLRPYARLVAIEICGRPAEVPENNTVLRGFQYLAPLPVSYGRFCWNQDCQYCRVTYDLGEGTASRAALACKLEVVEGMRITEVTAELRYCLRDLGLASGGNLSGNASSGPL
jgi:hypothetical protein